MIAKQLLDTGILQFGLFAEDGVTSPYRLRLEMLSAYPQLLQNVVYRGVQSLVEIKPFDRLVSHSDAIPLASALSLQTSVSLVYSRGRGEAPVHDLVGAYDVGHPACLIVNTLIPDIETFLADAKRVGLEIHTILEFVSVGQTIDNIDHRAIYTMNALIHELRQSNLITENLATKIVEA